MAQLEHDQLTPSGLVPEPRWSHQRHLAQLAKGLSQGQDLTVHFDCRFVTIERSGFLARAYVGKGEKRIPVTSIQAVQWKPPGARHDHEWVPRRRTARRNESAVIITRQQVPAFVAPRYAVEEAMAGRPPAQIYRRTPPPPPPASRTHRECCLGTGGKRCRPQEYGTSSCTRRDIPASRRESNPRIQLGKSIRRVPPVQQLGA